MGLERPKTMAKLYVFQDNGEMLPLIWGNGFQWQSFSWGDRILCSTDEDRLEFLENLISRYPGPFGLTYILEDNTDTHLYRQGRYSTANEITLDQIRYFFREFHDFLANDGRHHVMVTCRTTKGLVVYDQHDYFFVYGQLEALTDRLKSDGFVDKTYKLERHGHAIHDHHDTLGRLMEFWPWQWSDLESTDITKERTNLWRRIRLKVRAKWFDLTRRPPA